MSCWVVPSLAAEFWGVSVEQVMERIEQGKVETRNDHGFTVIDVAPEGPRQPMPRKPAFPPAPPSYAPRHESQLPQAIEEITESLERETFGDWRAARVATSMLRKAPGPVH